MSNHTLYPVCGSLVHKNVGLTEAPSESRRPSKTVTLRNYFTTLSVLLTLLFVFNSSLSQAMQGGDNKITAVLPAIMLLLDDSGIDLSIGQSDDRGYTSSSFGDNISFNIRPNDESVELVVELSQLPDGGSLDVYYNGALLTALGNGRHTLQLPETNVLPANIEFFASPTGITWQIDLIQALLSRGPRTPAEAQRFLTKATYGATDSDIQKLMSIGYEAWLDQQLQIAPTLNLPFFDQAVVDRKSGRNQLLVEAGETDSAVLDRGLGLGQLCVTRMDAWWNSTMRGRDQLRQRLAFALSQIFVMGDTGCEGGPPRAFSIYYDLLLNNAFGNYRQLLEDVTLNPMMGSYLSLRGSSASSAGPFLSPDENYAREVMQLFSIGLTQLKLDGSEKRVDGEPVETYDNAMVHDLARALTGWQVATGRFFPGWEAHPLEPWGPDGGRFHDRGSKTIINGVVIPPNLPIEEDLKRSLDAIFHHDNVAPFISKQLIQRFVTSNPSPAYVERVARIFNDNGAGMRGDLSSVIKAILLDTESLNSHLNLQGGKVKEPLLRVTQLWRAFKAQSPIKYIRYFHSDRDLGQRALGAETVFNFYTPTFAPQGEIQELNLVSPEFALTGDGQNIRYYTRMAQIIQSLPFGDPNPTYSNSFNLPMQLNLELAKTKADNIDELLSYLNELLFGGLMSEPLKNLVSDYLNDIPPDSNADSRRQKRVQEALLLLAVSPEYTVQR